MDSQIGGNGLMRKSKKYLFASLVVLSSIVFTCASVRQSNVLELNARLTAVESQTLVSQNGRFVFGFVSLGENDKYLSIWYTMSPDGLPTVVWMATLVPVVDDGFVVLSEDGELILYDSMLDIDPSWSSCTNGNNVTRAVLTNTGNLVLYTRKSQPVWQSFQEPTNTLVPGQKLTTPSQLISWSSSTNPSPGPFYLIMQYDQNLVLYTTPLRQANWSSQTWVPRPAFSSAYTELDEVGSLVVHYFNESGAPLSVLFNSSLDHGRTDVTRRVTLDIDGNVRMYSWDETTKQWLTVWRALSEKAISPPSPPPSFHTVSPPSPSPSPLSCSGSDCEAANAPAVAPASLLHASSAQRQSQSKPVIYLLASLFACVVCKGSTLHGMHGKGWECKASKRTPASSTQDSCFLY
eukprot:c28396_g1_i3 orf=380-1597(+)